VIRGAGLPDYLCLTCIVRAFVEAGEGFTAQLWGPGLDGLPIEVLVNGAQARSMAALSEENTTFRSALIKILDHAQVVLDDATRPRP
jgi:hypothetical protein